MDSRYINLAETLCGYSTELQSGERVLIEGFDIPEAMLIALIRSVRKRGAIPYVNVYRARVMRELIKNANGNQFALHAEVELQRMQKMDAYIAVRGAENIFEASDVPDDQMKAYMSAMKGVLDHRVTKTKWVVLRWPTPSMAQQAMKSSEAFEDFFFRVCTMDYARMSEGMEALKGKMEVTDKVQIKGPGTDLTFSIKGIGAVTCGGKRNIPDGEVFSCPVKESVNGVLQHNAPTVYRGMAFDNIRLEFRDGKIIDATGSDTTKLNDILDSDPGARYIGEFSLAFNPHILEPMRDILFDEKISGSFHFTPGQAYEEADNGNRSQVHWDMVSIQRKSWGGGEIYFDDELIRKDGLFVPNELAKLNPDYLLGES